MVLLGALGRFRRPIRYPVDEGLEFRLRVSTLEPVVHICPGGEAIESNQLHAKWRQLAIGTVGARPQRGWALEIGRVQRWTVAGAHRRDAKGMPASRGIIVIENNAVDRSGPPHGCRVVETPAAGSGGRAGRHESLRGQAVNGLFAFGNQYLADVDQIRQTVERRRLPDETPAKAVGRLRVGPSPTKSFPRSETYLLHKGPVEVLVAVSGHLVLHLRRRGSPSAEEIDQPETQTIDHLLGPTATETVEENTVLSDRDAQTGTSVGVRGAEGSILIFANATSATLNGIEPREQAVALVRYERHG